MLRTPTHFGTLIENSWTLGAAEAVAADGGAAGTPGPNFYNKYVMFFVKKLRKGYRVERLVYPTNYDGGGGGTRMQIIDKKKQKYV